MLKPYTYVQCVQRSLVISRFFLFPGKVLNPFFILFPRLFEEKERRSYFHERIEGLLFYVSKQEVCIAQHRSTCRGTHRMQHIVSSSKVTVHVSIAPSTNTVTWM